MIFACICRISLIANIIDHVALYIRVFRRLLLGSYVRVSIGYVGCPFLSRFRRRLFGRNSLVFAKRIADVLSHASIVLLSRSRDRRFRCGHWVVYVVSEGDGEHSPGEMYPTSLFPTRANIPHLALGGPPPLGRWSNLISGILATCYLGGGFFGPFSRRCCNGCATILVISPPSRGGFGGILFFANFRGFSPRLSLKKVDF